MKRHTPWFSMAVAIAAAIIAGGTCLAQKKPPEKPSKEPMLRQWSQIDGGKGQRSETLLVVYPDGRCEQRRPAEKGQPEKVVREGKIPARILENLKRLIARCQSIKPKERYWLRKRIICVQRRYRLTLSTAKGKPLAIALNCRGAKGPAPQEIEDLIQASGVVWQVLRDPKGTLERIRKREALLRKARRDVKRYVVLTKRDAGGWVSRQVMVMLEDPSELWVATRKKAGGPLEVKIGQVSFVARRSITWQLGDHLAVGSLPRVKGDPYGMRTTLRVQTPKSFWTNRGTGETPPTKKQLDRFRKAVELVEKLVKETRLKEDRTETWRWMTERHVIE